MSDQAKKDQLRLGFLTAVEDPERGFVGGLLVTNRFGRPLEFQCTTPVKPNRTQQILYGPTLRPYLLSELIGKTLLDKVGVKPHLVLTEDQSLCELREHVDIPVGCFSEQTMETLQIGNRHLEFHSSHDGEMEHVRHQCKDVPTSADLKEPFDRIREALQETMKAAVGRA
ncbi:MAG: hypothetical protein C0478_00535 [Planctomyces sp.]|jgi:hypothetical protein|nr:hypothetical protein [Planctomyces sp.]